jgi:hypothetical protein
MSDKVINHFNCNRCGTTLAGVTPHKLNPANHLETHWSIPICHCVIRDLKAGIGKLLDVAEDRGDLGIFKR